MAPPRMGIIEAYKEGAASLTVTLLRPLVRAGEIPETVPQGEKQLSFVIDKPEINAYLDAVDDTNSIHRGENPVVPGLCMIEHLWRALNKPLPLNWDVKFKCLLLRENRLTYTKTARRLTVTAAGASCLR